MSSEFWELGMGEPTPVSGIHGTGLSDLMDLITMNHMKKIVNVAKENATNIAFIGRPNVGKSSLFNKYFPYLYLYNSNLLCELTAIIIFI